MGGQPVRKILVSARGIFTLQVEVKFLHIRTKIPINRKGVTALTVFLLSFFVGICRKVISGVGCRSPPANLDYSKKFRLEVKDYGVQQSQRRKKMAAMERSRRKAA
jgi:hypothetical protein